MASYRRDSNVGDWAAVVKELHGAYTDSKIREMDRSLNNLKLEAQQKENSLQREHEKSLLSQKQSWFEENVLFEKAHDSENAVHQVFVEDEETGETVVDVGATMQNVQEHSRFKNAGANLTTSTFTKANAFFNMEDFSPSYTTQED